MHFFKIAAKEKKYWIQIIIGNVSAFLAPIVAAQIINAFAW